MFVDLGEREKDVSLYAIEMLKVYKIQSLYNDYTRDTIIPLEAFDREMMDYNNSYDQGEDELFEFLIQKISQSITRCHYSLEEFPFIETNDPELTSDDIDDMLSNTTVMTIPIISETPQNVLNEFKKIVPLVGIIDEYFDDTIFYQNGCIYMIMDSSSAIDVLVSMEFVKLLYGYRDCGILPC